MKDWQSVLVESGTTLARAVKIIDKSALRIGLVVDDSRRLLGTVTDGDIRRALLDHISFDVPVNEVMCVFPKVARPDWGRERVLAAMENDVLLQLPVVDSEGIIVGLQTLHELIGKKSLSTPVFIMAGGFGTRLHPLTEQCPKPLLKVGGKPILELTLERLIEFGFHNFYISTHFLSEMIRDYFGNGEKWGVSISYTREESPLGTGGALGLLPHDEINEPLLLMNGDLLTTLNFESLLDFHNEQNCAATMAVRTYEHQVPFGVIENEGCRLRSIVEKPLQKCFVNAGVYVLQPEIVKSVDEGTVVDMPDLLENWIGVGSGVSTFPLNEYWLDIGRMDDFNRAQIESRNLFQ